MARKQTIKFLMKSELNSMAAYGRSKYQDQQRTHALRSQMKKEGKSWEECLRVNFSKDYIYSYQTMKNYQYEVDRFANYLAERGLKKISLEEAKEHIQEYLDYEKEKGLRPASINSSMSAICKALHADIINFDRPKRSVSDIVRSRGEHEHDMRNAESAKELLEANRLMGLRRNELKGLKASDIREVDGKVIIYTKGKSGKHNQQIFYLPEEKEKILSYKEGKQPTDRIFDRELFKNDADLHYMRELRAKDVYEQVRTDMRQNPERRDFYITEIQRIFAESGRTLKEDLDKPYITRGENRERLEAEGREVSFDRVALMMVSVTVLNHFRSSVSCNYYVGK